MIINLNEYISWGLFLKNLENSDSKPDKVIFDIDTLENKDSSIKLDFLSDNLEFWINWALKKIIWKSKKKDKIDLSIIWLNVGSVGIFDKFFSEYNDVSLAMDFGLDVYEPVDLVNFFQILEKDWTKYVRITYKDYSTNIFANVEWKYDDIFSL